MNGKLAADFGMTQRRVLPILGRSFSVAMKAGQRLAIAAWTRWAQVWGREVRVAHIPGRFTLESRGAFDPDYMKVLFHEGRQSGRDGEAFARVRGMDESAIAGLPR